MVCEEMRTLARRLMDDFRQRNHLEGRPGKARELASVEAELAECNALITEHRLNCPICRAAGGPVLVPRPQPLAPVSASTTSDFRV